MTCGGKFSLSTRCSSWPLEIRINRTNHADLREVGKVATHPEFWRTTGSVAELKFAIEAITIKKMLRKVTLTNAVILLYSGLLPNRVNGGPSESFILEPASGVLFGLYYGAGSPAQTAAKLERTPAVHLTYYAWAADWTGSFTKADLAEGRIPLVNWEPHPIDFAKIINGREAC
jgi:hypothetical protein